MAEGLKRYRPKGCVPRTLLWVDFTVVESSLRCDLDTALHQAVDAASLDAFGIHDASQRRAGVLNMKEEKEKGAYSVIVATYSS